LEAEEKEILNQRLRIENAQRTLALAKDCGYSSEELKDVFDLLVGKQEVLMHLISSGKIKDVVMLESGSEVRYAHK
jgi:hydroxylamine reductase (hybrid-cluster protein)